MSNPLDPIVETLKAVEPRSEAVERTVAAVRKPAQSRMIPLAVGVSGASLFVLWPRGESGLAWAQLAAQELPARYYETTVKISKGKSRLMFETWVDRSADSARHVYMMPLPGSSTLRDYERIETPKGHYWCYNGVATYSLKPRPHGEFDPRTTSAVGRKVDLQSILDDKSIHQLGIDPGFESRLGKVDRYRLDNPTYTFDAGNRKYRESGRRPFTVYVLSGSHRIVGYDAKEEDGSEWRTTIEYPESFPAETFRFPLRKDVTTFSQEKMEADVQRVLAHPLATLRAGGQTSQLRLVVQGTHKELWTVWDGAKPNGDLAQKVQVLGVRNMGAFGMAAFTSKGDRGYFAPFGGHAVNLDRRVDKVDLRVPVFAPGKPRSRFVGYATAREIPVLQVSEFYATGIGLGKHIRR